MLATRVLWKTRKMFYALPKIKYSCIECKQPPFYIFRKCKAITSITKYFIRNVKSRTYLLYYTSIIHGTQ